MGNRRSDMESANSLTRKAVWDALCDLEWHIRYCSALADRNHSRHRYIRVAILVGVMSEGILLYGGTLSPWLFIPGAVVALALACLTIWDATSDYANDAAVLRMVVILCQRLRSETESLWREVEQVRRTNDQVEMALANIYGQWAVVTQAIPLGTNEKLNRQTAEAADKEMQLRYEAQLPTPSA